MPNTMKFHLFLGAFFLLLSCSPLSNTEENTSLTPPNIIFILTDDLRWGDLGSFYQNHRAATGNTAHPWQLTPHLDEMAQQGIMLTNHYSNAPVCAPSRASFLTGMHQGHSTVRNNFPIEGSLRTSGPFDKGGNILRRVFFHRTDNHTTTHSKPTRPGITNPPRHPK